MEGVTPGGLQQKWQKSRLQATPTPGIVATLLSIHLPLFMLTNDLLRFHQNQLPQNHSILEAAPASAGRRRFATWEVLCLSN